MKKIVLSILVLTSALIGCKGSKETASNPAPATIDCNVVVVTFANDIKPIFEANCTRCHNTNKKAGYNFFTYESAKKAADSGVLAGSLNHRKGYSKMPLFKAKLSQDLINKIECWIKNGMPE